MKIRWLGVSLIVLLLVFSLAVFSRTPLQMAHGSFQSEFHVAGMAFIFQISFNVQDRGDAEADRGTFSMNVFDWHTGEHLAIYHAVHVWDVRPYEAGLAFNVSLVAKQGGLPPPAGGVLVNAVETLIAYPDRVDIVLTNHLPLYILKGKIVFKTF